MNPWTTLAPGRLTSTRATVLLSAFATSRERPSGDRLSALGVLPGGRAGASAIEICSLAARAARSTTQTALVLAQATNRRPSLASAIALGCSPTGISPRGSRVAASKRSTLAPPQSETSTVPPSGVTRVVYPSAGSSNSLTTLPLARSTAERSLPRACTANRREPSGLIESPPTKLSLVGFRSATAVPFSSPRSIRRNSPTLLAAPPEA